MQPELPDGTDRRFFRKLPGVVPRPQADSRSGASCDTAAKAKKTQFRDWALL